MASKTKIEFIDAGFQDVLSSEGCKSKLEEVTSQIASRAGEGFEPHVKYYGPGHRYIGFVNATTIEATKAESENKVLSGAVR